MTTGIHHVTAIAGDAHRNLHFYTQVLGLRLVKKTVNFDDPGTYHLYYGDGAGSPGTILTFFPWAHIAPGRRGAGTTIETAFRVPEGAVAYWMERFAEHGVQHDAPEERYGRKVLTFQDADGTSLALVERMDWDRSLTWAGEAVPVDHAISGFEGVTLMVADPARTAAVLQDVLGFTHEEREEGRLRLSVPGQGLGGSVSLCATADTAPSHLGGGSVHHVAFRAVDDAAQAAMVQRLRDQHKIAATDQKDRQYFRSIYFREPGGVLFEIATDQPGFTVDEAPDALGQKLKLPRFLEPRRQEIETRLPKLT